MKRPTFMQGAALALILAVGSAVAFVAFVPAFDRVAVLRCLITAQSAAYVIYLLYNSAEKTGRLTVPLLWIISAVCIALFVPGLLPVCIAHLGLVWLVRAVYFHSGLLPAVLDLGLCAVSLTAAIAAAKQSHSVFLSVWTFYLLQALFVAIPSARQASAGRRMSRGDDHFEHAHRRADEELRRLHRNHQ
jgi:hypothetical protein